MCKRLQQFSTKKFMCLEKNMKISKDNILHASKHVFFLIKQLK